MIKNYLKESNPDKIINSPNNSDDIKQQLTIFKEKIIDKNIAERFIAWFQQQLQKAEKNNEDLSDITRNAVVAINIISKKLSAKDIKKINPFDLKNIEQIYPIINKLNPDFERAESVNNNEDLEKVFENDEALVINVKTYNGSCFLSQGQHNWCTSRYPGYFRDYAKYGPIFRVYIKKPVSKKYKICSMAPVDYDDFVFSDYENNQFDPTPNPLSEETYVKIVAIYEQKQKNNSYFENDEKLKRKAVEDAREYAEGELKLLIKEYSDEIELERINGAFGNMYVYHEIIKSLGELAHTSDEWGGNDKYFEYDDYDGYDYNKTYEDDNKAIKIIKNKLYELGCLNKDYIQWVENNRVYPKDPNQLDLFKSESLKKYLSNIFN